MWLRPCDAAQFRHRLTSDVTDSAVSRNRPHYLALLPQGLRVSRRPQWEDTPFTSEFVEDFGRYASLADLFRQIGYDERLHKLESEANLAAPRFS